MNDTTNQLWHWAAGAVVWCFDHWSGMAALVLFALQAVYQIYRIRLIKRQVENGEKDGTTIRG